MVGWVRSVQPGGGSGQSRWGGGQVSPAGRGGSVQLVGGVRSVHPGGGQSSWGGGQSVGGGVSILRPLAGGMPLAFTQEDFLVAFM